MEGLKEGLKSRSIYLVIFTTILSLNSVMFLTASHDSRIGLQVTKKVFSSLVSMRVKSAPFIENVYFFNVEGIYHQMQTFIGIYENNHPELSGCLSIEMHSINGTEQAERVACTQNDSLGSLSTMPSSATIQGVHDIMVGAQNLGKFRWIASNAPDLPWYKQASFSPFLFALIILLELLMFGWLYAHYEHKLAVVAPLDRCDVKTCGIQDKSVRLVNIGKIIDKNKRFFAVNKDLLMVTYQHPYSNLTYCNGTEQKLRCSLTELESSFRDDFVRINRSCLISSGRIAEYGNVRLGRDNKNHELVLELKGKSLILEVGKQYYGSLQKLFHVTLPG